MFLVIFLYFFQLSFVSSSPLQCPPSFDCKNFTSFSFPFYNSTDPRCGYFKLDCSKEFPEIHLQNDKVLEIKSTTQNDRRFLVYNKTLDQHLRQRNCDVFNSLDLPELISVANKQDVVTLFKCTQNTSQLENFKFERCQDHSLYYNLSVKANNTHTLPKNCIVFELPYDISRTTNNSTDLFSMLSAEFLIYVRAYNCDECLEKQGQCQVDGQQYKCVGGLGAREKSNRKVIIIAAVVGFSVILGLVMAIFFVRRRYKRKAFAYFSSKSKDLEDPSVYFGVSVFSYAELQDATNHFDSSQELGDGGFGTVYYGKLRDGREVAVKRLYEHNFKRVQQFMNEVEILTKLRHKNLVSLYGCTSRKSRELLLVYEYISNGTVADHLHGDRAQSSPLTWQTRMKIAIETASALVYLHASEIIHRDVKTNNILLENNFCVKVADFGLSRLVPNDVTHVSTAPQGTPGYVDPEYHQCFQLTDKSDVYSFGVVLIELISSMPAIDISRSRDEIVLANMAINRIQKCALDELIDPHLGSDPDTERMTTSVAELAFRCLQFDSEARPTMVEVLEVLKGIQVEENVDEVRELPTVKSEMPPPSPEMEHVGLLKGGVTASPISVTAKWHSASSGSTTPNTSVVN